MSADPSPAEPAPVAHLPHVAPRHRRRYVYHSLGGVIALLGLYPAVRAVLGGVGNIQGAFLGGMVIGIVAAISDFQFDPRWTQAVVFAVRHGLIQIN